MADPFTGDEFVVIFPQFAAMPNLNATVSAVLNTMVIQDVAPAAFGTEYVKALMLLTAHFFVLLGRRGGGALTSESVGQLSRSFQAMPEKATLDSTMYGQMFRKLARRKVGSSMFVGQSYPPHAGIFPAVP